MKIYSWNMFYRNRECDRAFAFIAQSDFDIFCLQEVPENFFVRLTTLSYHIASAVENNLIFCGKCISMYNVILSKHPIINPKIIPLAYYEPTLPWNTRFLERGVYWLLIWPKELGNRHALCADIEIPERGMIQIFNLHLPLMYPRIRAEEFETIMLHTDSRLPTIVCGDFNILEKLHITPLNWLLGGRVSDMLCYKRERMHMEKRFITYELTNALRGKITHPLSRSQLDHILVSHPFSVKNATVIPDRYGSDHHPICVEVA